MLKLTTLMLVLYSVTGLASQRQMIDTLGISPKGQYVALEEYGYKSDKHSYYVTIKIMNVWKKEYVGSPVEVELPATRPHDLRKARDKAKLMAKGELEKFNISG